MIRIGHNPNTNMLPMFYFLPRQHPLYVWVTGEPTRHNAMLADGQIDMAPISSFSYGEHWEEYYLFPDLSVSNKGRVGSILLFSKRPLSELDGRTIVLTSNSATSVNLLKIILHKFYGVNPIYLTKSFDVDKMLEEGDAALLIADMAIRASFARNDLYVYDLGEEWLSQTGHSMTFAVWAFPKKLRDRGDEVREVHRLLLQARDKAMSNMPEIIQTCCEMVGGPEQYWREYFSRFTYGFNDQLLAGLKAYYDACFELGLLPSIPRLNFWP